MSVCTVDDLRAALGVGSVYTDSVLQGVCDAADEVLLPMLWVNEYPIIGHSNDGTVGTLYFSTTVYDTFYVGQTLNIQGCGSHFNGNKTVTAVGTYSVNVTTNHATDTPYHPVIPYGVATAESYTDWTTDPAVKQAAVMIAVDIWQARNSANGGQMSLDGTPMPYRMGASMLSRVRGLIAHALSPKGLIG